MKDESDFMQILVFHQLSCLDHSSWLDSWCTLANSSTSNDSFKLVKVLHLAVLKEESKSF
jgi:hypothetical protein